MLVHTFPDTSVGGEADLACEADRAVNGGITTSGARALSPNEPCGLIVF